MHGKIAPSGPFCGTKEATFISEGAGEATVAVYNKPGLRVWPNPSNGKFRIGLTGIPSSESVRIEIFSIRGETVLSETLAGEAVHEFSLDGRASGIYVIKVVAGDNVMTSKLILDK